jgi:hypothetical protein
MSTESTIPNWEQRALAAEAASGQLESKLEEMATTLAQARDALDASERRRRIDLELVQSEAVDIETARLLTEAAVAQMKAPDVARAVADLRKRKPFLFRPARKQASAMNAAGRPAPVDELSQIAEQARTTGDKRALLQYLRARRGA